MRHVLNKIVSVSTIVTILFSYSPFVAAAEAPDANLTTTINSQIQSEVSSINIDPHPQIVPQTEPEASSNNTNVENTGDNANTNSSSTENSTTGANSTNDADVSQDTTAVADTGNNEAEKNIAFGGNAGMITTGDATINVTGVVAANNNKNVLNGGGTGGGSNTNVANSGNNVTTSTSSTGTETLFSNQSNSALIHQGTNANANTGNNKANGNISIGGVAGGIITGNASINTNYLVAANGNVAIVGGNGSNGGPGSNASIYILNSGNMLNATSVGNQNHYLVVTNENRALISQTCGIPEREMGQFVESSGCLSNTGGNQSSRGIAMNGDVGVIKTGDAVVNVNMAAAANSNTTIVNGNGSGDCGTNTGVDNTGDNVNVTNANNCNDTTLVNSENDATVRQSVNAQAITGRNRANRNIALNGNAGIIETGNATINIIMVAQVNDNNTTINEPSASLNGGNDINVVNTGDNVNVDSTSNHTTNVNVTSTNYLALTQEVHANVNSGGNDVSGNLSCGGAGSFIKTGYTDVTINMQASGNSNEVIIGDPIDPADPISPTPTTNQIQNQALSDPQQSDPESHAVSQGGGSGNSIVSGVSYTVTTLAAAIQKATGKVLGAKAKKLPATGAEDTVYLLVIIFATFAVGRKLQTLEIDNRSL